jgi:hypothetical protein
MWVILLVGELHLEPRSYWRIAASSGWSNKNDNQTALRNHVEKSFYKMRTTKMRNDEYRGSEHCYRIYALIEYPGRIQSWGWEIQSFTRVLYQEPASHCRLRSSLSRERLQYYTNSWQDVHLLKLSTSVTYRHHNFPGTVHTVQTVQTIISKQRPRCDTVGLLPRRK